MNSNGGCCIARYGGGGGGGGGGGIYGMSKVDRLMLKFRPIAPKPISAGFGSGGLTTENGEGYVKCARNKRKYVRVKNTKKDKNASKSGIKKKRKVTLSLLPETPERKEKEPVTGFPDLASPVQKRNYNNSQKTTQQQQQQQPPPVGGVTQVVFKPLQQKLTSLPRLPQVVSYVTVECVTDTWLDVQGLGCRDEERLMNLEKDTCPGFVSDGQDRVVWTNKAYRKMAGGDDVAVVLVRKDTWNQSPVMYPAFTCKVRASTSAGISPRPNSPTLTLPCDVWRMERGGYAWRLDVKAALSLGR